MDPVPVEGCGSDKGILGVAPASSGDRKSRCLIGASFHTGLLDEVGMVPLTSDHAHRGHVGRGMRSERMIHTFGRAMDFGASTARLSGRNGRLQWMSQVPEAVLKGGISHTKLSLNGVGEVSDPAAHITEYRGLYPVAMRNAEWGSVSTCQALNHG